MQVRQARLVKFLMVTVFMITLSAWSFGANHYVRAGASGNGSGSDWTNACTDFSGSCASQVRGDTYYVATGTYASHNFNSSASGTTPITIKKATVADHGTATGWSDTFGTGTATFNGQINFGSSYWVFDGVTGGGPGNWTSGFGFKISVSGTSPALRTDAISNVTVRHTEIQGTQNTGGGGSIAQDGVAIYGGKFITLSYYSIHDMGRCPFFISTQDFVAEYGYTGIFRSTSAAHAELASIWGFSIGSNRITFRYNLFTHSEGTGGLIFDNQEDITGGGMKVYGNVFYRPAGDTWEINNGLIGGWTGGGGEKFYGVEVYNNTFYNTTSADGNSPLTNFPNTYGSNIAYNNLFYNTNSVNYSRFTNANNSVVTSDPFVNAAGLDFRLKAATATGTTVASPYNSDPWGLARGTDGVWDRGAYEFNSGSVAMNPPTGVTAVVR
jgi:hypothetical protein